MNFTPFTGSKTYKSNHFEDFLPKNWEKSAFEGYQTLVKLGLRPPSDVFPPPIEIYKDWKPVTTVATVDPVATTVATDKHESYRQKHREELAKKERTRRLAATKKLMDSV